jgi:predicted negative regulator of RcsB-dependent stress response
MDEDISIINSNTRNEKVRNFFIKNKTKLVLFTLFIALILIVFFGYEKHNNNKKIKISNKFNYTVIEYSESNKKKTANELTDIVKMRDSTYSPLSLYFIIENNLILDKNKINDLFDILIEKTSLENEITNLIIYKKALYNADQVNEGTLLNILNPLINSESVWKSHALYLIAEFFYSKNEKQKSKEFFNQIINLANANQYIKQQTEKRLNRDLSE